MSINTHLNRLVSVKPHEISALLISCTYFFLVLCSYYIVRPIRDEMLIANGVANIQWLLVLTLTILLAITPAFAWLTSRFKTRQFMSYCSLFFAGNLLVFYFLFDVEQRSVFVTRSFYVWVNIFNMFIVSLFWSFMNDIYSRTQSKRLFAFIGAGGTTGAICGPIITTTLVSKIGLAPLLVISAIVLAASVVCINWLTRWQNPEFENEDLDKNSIASNAEPLKGGLLDGISLILRSPYLLGICGFVLLYAICILSLIHI